MSAIEAVLRLPVAALLAAVALTACGETSVFPPSATRYALHAVDGVSVPAALVARPEMSVTLVADTLILWSHGWSSRTEYVHRSRPLLEPPIDVIDTESVKRRYSLRGDSLIFPWRCPPDVLGDCAPPPPRGQFSADRSSLTLRFFLTDFSTQLRDYRRIPD